MRAGRAPVQPPPTPLALTGREAQVAHLASVRWSDREIAAALFSNDSKDVISAASGNNPLCLLPGR